MIHNTRTIAGPVHDGLCRGQKGEQDEAPAVESVLVEDRCDQRDKDNELQDAHKPPKCKLVLWVVGVGGDAALGKEVVDCGRNECAKDKRPCQRNTHMLAASRAARQQRKANWPSFAAPICHRGGNMHLQWKNISFILAYMPAMVTIRPAR